MKKGKVIYLGQLVLSKAERGLWYDHDKKSYDKKGWGVPLKIWAGWVVRPIPKFWIKGNNPWQGDEPWFVITFPFWLVLPFISLALWNWGCYFGAKIFTVTEEHRKPERYGKWFPYKEDGEYLTFSATTRKTRWK